MSKNTIITIVLVMIFSGVGFFAGTKYQQSKFQSAFGQGNRQFNGQFMGQGVRGGNANGGTGAPNNVRFRGGQVIGEIISADDKSVTVKLPDGSSKIVLFTDKTTVSKSTDGSTSDLKTGETVAVMGETNSDGSVSAVTIQLNPAFRMQFISGTPAVKK